MSTKKQQPKKEISAEELQKQLEVIEKAADDTFIAEYTELCKKYNREFNVKIGGTIGEPLQGVLFVLRKKKA